MGRKKQGNTEAKDRALARRREKARARYRYMRTTLGAESWQCREGQHSVRAMVSFFPDHKFPSELVSMGKSGPKKPEIKK